MKSKLTGTVVHEAFTEDPRFGATLYAVEADSFARQALWEQNERLKITERHLAIQQWEQDSMGLAVQIGEFGGMPVVVSFSWAVLNGKRVCFYEPTSMVTHSGMLDDWLNAHLPDNAKTTNADNFHLCRNFVRGHMN